jgi:hypothetical protein
MKRRALRACGALAMLAAAGTADAVTVTVTPGLPQLQLRIGAAGGTISTVTFSVPAASAGTGTPVVGTTNAAAGSAQGASFPACAANNVLVWARARAVFPNTRTATLQVNSSGSVTSGANAIPFTEFDWITSSGPEIPSGGFTGSAAQTLMSFMNSREVGMCLQFRFLNTTIYPAGTYNGQLTFNLNMP